MTSNSSGAVFFLGTRAHYQVLQQPLVKNYDVENGNTSSETIYQNPSVQERWPEGPSGSSARDPNWNCYQNTEVTITNETGKSKLGVGVKRRNVLRQSETTLCEREEVRPCEREELRPALLNAVSEGSPQKPKPARSRQSVFGFISSFLRRRAKCTSEEDEEIQFLQHHQRLRGASDVCTFSESCGCDDCQGRYFEVDEEDFSSDDDDFSAQYAIASMAASQEFTQQYSQDNAADADDEDDEVFVTTPPADTTSTDMLLDGDEPVKMSISSDDVEEEEGYLNLEVAAGTPVLLNYLLNHPFTCNIQ